MVDFGNSVSSLTKTSVYRGAVFVAAGYVVSVVAKNVMEPRLGLDLPDEAYGSAGILLGDYMGNSRMQYGGGLYSAHALAKRTGFDSTVMTLGA